jgi:hypothetical protein
MLTRSRRETTRFRRFPHVSGAAPDRGEVRLVIRRPHHAGIWMDQVNHRHIPARFAKSVRVGLGKDSLLSV